MSEFERAILADQWQIRPDLWGFHEHTPDLRCCPPIVVIAVGRGAAEAGDSEMLLEDSSEDVQLHRESGLEGFVKAHAIFLIVHVLLMRHDQARYEYTLFWRKNVWPVVSRIRDGSCSHVFIEGVDGVAVDVSRKLIDKDHKS